MAVCAQHRDRAERWLAEGVRRTTIRKLLACQGVVLTDPLLYRSAVEQMLFGRPTITIPVLDDEPGHEMQVDTGSVGGISVAERTRPRRHFRAWILTAVYSRHRFAYPTFDETTARAIEACEAAWRFFGGVCRVLIPDHTKAIIVEADRLGARITPASLEYAQARGLHVDAARVRHAQDEGRAEHSVPTVRESGSGGERFADLEAARERGRFWALEEYGTRRQSRIQQAPLALFEQAEHPVLLPAPTVPRRSRATSWRESRGPSTRFPIGMSATSSSACSSSATPCRRRRQPGVSSRYLRPASQDALPLPAADYP